MKKSLITAIAAVVLCASGTTIFAADDYPFKKEIEARRAVMKIYSYNLGMLGAMAKGKAEYNAELASAAANNLLAAVSMENGTMWPADSHADADGLADKTRSKSEIWSTYPKISEASQALKDAAAEMAANAGNGLDAVKSAMGAVGKSCKGCHDDFRVPKDKK